MDWIVCRDKSAAAARLEMVTVYYTWISDNLARVCENCWLEALPLDKRDVISHMQFEKGRAASLLGLQLVKRGIRALGFADFDLKAIRFPRGGKPYCNLPVDFNISHSGDMVVCALSTNSRIGIDIERLREIRIAAFERFLKTRERAWVGENTRRFFELWTQKEAVVKSYGEGGITNIRRVNIEHGKGTLASQTWTLHELSIHSNYVAHVAIADDGLDMPVDVRHLAIIK
jgi:4'-phosphopantetheinyl transferase